MRGSLFGWMLSDISKMLKLIKGAKGNLSLILRLLFRVCSNLRKGKQKNTMQEYALD